MPYYDNFHALHAAIVLALIGMMVIYTMYFYGKIKASYGAMAFIIVMVTIGFGAALEMGNIPMTHTCCQGPLGDITGNTQMQGSPTQDAHDDTMNDLITDHLGAIAGAAIGVWLIRRNDKKGGPLEGS